MAVAKSRSFPILLGYPDEEITGGRNYQVDFTTNKIGGSPDWIVGEIPESELACCQCQSPCVLVCQIYAPQETSIYHRTLYIFACIQTSCWNASPSWKCFRGQCVAKSEALSAKNQTAPAEKLEWDIDDDWGDEDDNLASKVTGTLEELKLDCDPNGNPMAESPQPSGAVARLNDEASAEVEADQIQDVILDPPPDVGLVANNSAIPGLFFGGSQNSTEKISGHFKPHFLAVEEDYQNELELSEHERQLLMEYKARESMAAAAGDEKGQPQPCHDGYEEVAPRHGDMGLHKFITAINRNHGHVLRYCNDVRHVPLFICQQPEKELSLPHRCSNCGGPVTCEIQLLPTLIPSLVLASSAKAANSGIEFGNVLVYTCVKSCWGSSDSQYKREHVLVEAEPL